MFQTPSWLERLPNVLRRMKSSVSQVHIGELIKSRAKAMRLGPTELGARIETSKQNIYGIFKRQSIDTELLTRISLALDYDFFTHLSQAVARPTIRMLQITLWNAKMPICVA